MARRTKSLTKSRRKKARTLADNEGKYLTPDEEAEAGRTRRKTNKPKVMSRLNAELCQQADDEVQMVLE